MERDIKKASTNRETRKHIKNVHHFISILIKHLRNRSKEHDLTKLDTPEVELFTEYTEKLAGCTYGSDEYKQFLEGLKPALDHHYAKNRHHPEHWKNGIDDMDLIDLLEMFADWKAATLRHDDGNIQHSIDHNAKRFNISPQLVNIFRNTARLLEDEKHE